MIPKASGGSHPRDQRPITVLDVLYRIWSKGLVREWAPAIQRDLLGSAAMGLRAQSPAIHVAQLLSDIILLRRRQRRPLFLVSFDLEKCYDSIPWWAIFHTLLESGAPSARVTALGYFYKHLRRCFRYGQVEGGWWFAANGFPQGCSLSPDLLNILMESFHRWARASGLGVLVEGLLIPSVSFADDLALIASSLDDALYLANGYLEWCQLLGLRVTKVQLWTNGSPCTVQIGELSVVSSPTFRMVGVVLGQCERDATEAHITPRLEKAIVTAQRLQALDFPAAICSLLWRTTVLPQALYGCEVRNVLPSQVAPLLSLGKTLLATKAPLQLSDWRNPATLCGLPLGDTALRDPSFEIRLRQLVWLQLLANLPTVVGVVHRFLAWQDTWSPPQLFGLPFSPSTGQSIATPTACGPLTGPPCPQSWHTQVPFCCSPMILSPSPRPSTQMDPCQALAVLLPFSQTPTPHSRPIFRMLTAAPSVSLRPFAWPCLCPPRTSSPTHCAPCSSSSAGTSFPQHGYSSVPTGSAFAS